MGRYEGQAEIQTAPSKWSRLLREFLDGKKREERGKVAVFRVQGEWRPQEGRDKEGKQQGWSKAEPWKMRELRG